MSSSRTPIPWNFTPNRNFIASLGQKSDRSSPGAVFSPPAQLRRGVFSQSNIALSVRALL